MDQTRFDEITRALAGKRSRRSTLRVLGSLAAAAAAGATGRGGAQAAARCRSTGVACSKNGDCCSGACTPSSAGRRACGECQTADQCPAAPGTIVACRQNICVVTGCTGQLTLCGAVCVDLSSDPQHCGSCDTVVDTDRGESCCFGNVCSAQEFCFDFSITGSQTALATGFCSITQSQTSTATATPTAG